MAPDDMGSRFGCRRPTRLVWRRVMRPAPNPLVVFAACLELLACAGAPPSQEARATSPEARSTPAPDARAVQATAPPANKPAPQLLAENSPRSTPEGTTFTVPGGWSIESSGPRTVLIGPEPGLKIAIVDSPIKDGDEAVATAWRVFREDFNRPLKLVKPRPARNGWDESREYDYETSPNERIIVSGRALRHGEAWTAVLFELGQAPFERRLAQIVLVSDSLRPKGYAKESFAGRTANTLDAERLKRIADMVERGRNALDIPGVAISLVQGGKVVFAGGFGVRELGKPEKIDADTLFIIASNTKALTTLLLATEVDRGKLTWETPVTQVYPAFKLGDAEITRQVLMKHLICACTGLPRQDFEWIFEFNQRTPKSAMELLATVQPTTKFGETFQYSNLMAAAAGYIGGNVEYPKKELGAAYDEAMKKRIFEPLGMKDTTFDFVRALRRNHASPHGPDFKGKMALATMDLNRSAIPIRPAGGAWSNVKDVSRYVQMELANGKLPNGRQLVSAEVLLARRAPQVTIGEYAIYGMGLSVDTEYKVAVVHHGGDLVGFHSDMFWLPEQGVGGVILTNADGGWLLRRPFIRKVLEELFDGKPEAVEDVESAAQRFKAEVAKARERLVVPPDVEAVQKLAKHYWNDALGTIDVRENGATRVFDFGEWKSAVASRKNDDGTTSMITVDPGVSGFPFVMAEREGKRALILRDAQHEYMFLESPEKQARSTGLQTDAATGEQSRAAGLDSLKKTASPQKLRAQDR